MPQSTSNVYVHFTWSTLNHAPLIHESVARRVHGYITREFELIGCKVYAVDGVVDHVHGLVRINQQLSVAAIMKQVKGNSSHNFNKAEWMAEKFAWQSGYYAFSVSENALKRIIDHILSQKEYHISNSYETELAELLGSTPATI